jgi:hypothetical protein
VGAEGAVGERPGVKLPVGLQEESRKAANATMNILFIASLLGALPEDASRGGRVPGVPRTFWNGLPNDRSTINGVLVQ